MTPARASQWLAIAALILLATVGQIVFGALSGFDRYAGKGFGYRLLVYPLLMLTPVIIWWLLHRRTAPLLAWPWAAFALIMLPFLIDISGNTLNLYDTFDPWDNINHFVNWVFLLWGIGLLLARANIQPRWALFVAITGLGALLAIGWELGEWYTFIRQGTELSGAYEDTLSDELLGTLGGFVAAIIVDRHQQNQTKGLP